MAQTLLLADDSVTIQRVIELTFADEDVRVVAVSDGDQAIAAIDQRPPDIVLADIGMPGKDGYQVAEHVKNSPRLAHIPVVLLTGAFEPVDQARAAQVGCDGVLAKPFEPQLVITRVRELLAKRPHAAPPAPEPRAVADPRAVAEPRAMPPAADLPLAPPAAPRPAVPPAAPPPAESYFDRLDEAFANLAGPGPQPPPVTPSLAPPALPPPPAPIVDEAAEWFSARPPQAPTPATADRVQRAEPAAVARPPVPEPPPDLPQAAARPLPPLADAFAALLAAERQAPPDAAPSWPAAAAAPAPAPPDPQELVEEVTRRVLAQMSDRVVRETVAEIVVNVAERLIRAEIDRIKNSLKQ